MKADLDMGVACELNRAGMREADVHLAAGLPLTWVRKQRESFREYLLRNERVEYRYNRKDYRVRFVGCSVYPQGYAAVVNSFGSLKGTNLLADIGNGIQIFEDFCKSGHMVTEDILAMRVLGDDARIPTYRFVNVLLRKNRRFYKGDESNFVNLFSANYTDDFPDPFVRVDILNWLYCIKDKEGPSKDKGYFPIINMMKSLQMLGHNLSVIERELSYLIKRGLVVCENFNDQFKSQDLIEISISGRLHMKMLSDVVYLAACSEDAIFKNTETMMQISNRLKVRETNSRLITLLNARDFVNYLIKYREEYLSNGSDFLSEETLIPPFDIKTSLNAVEQAIKGNSRLFRTISAIDRLKPYSQVGVQVGKIITRGIVCIIPGEETIGFISFNDVKHPFPLEVIANIKTGDQLVCEVTGFSIEHHNFQLRFVGFSESEVLND